MYKVISFSMLKGISLFVSNRNKKKNVSEQKLADIFVCYQTQLHVNISVYDPNSD